MRLQTKGFTSLLLTLAFLALSISGVVLYMTPQGRVAHWTGWSLLGLDKEQWQALHTNMAILFLVVALVHIALNWSMLWCYIKKRTGRGLNLKREMILAVAIAGLVTGGTILGWPPFSTVTDVNEQIKDYWERRSATAPAPHAEEFSLKRLAGQMGLSAEDVVKTLRGQGIEVADAEQTVRAVAENNGRTPAEIHAILRNQFPEGPSAVPGRGQGFGGGRGQGGRAPRNP